LVAVLLPTVALSNKLDLGVDLGVEVSLKVPDLSRGTRVDLLINFLVVLQILAIPYDPAHGIADCAAGGPPTKSARNGLNTADSRWYDNGDGTWFMAVVIDPAFTSDEKNTIYAGMIDIQNKSCMRFYIYNEAEIQGYDYVRIERKSSGCWSYIGRLHQGKQLLNLAPPACSGCGHCIWAGTVAHELLHAIGFDHQQNTPGRDQYVTINWGNIQSGQEHNFQEADGTRYTAFGAPYDYQSVMHYPKNAFSSNGGDTIYVKNGAAIGQRNGLSDWDGYKVKKMHGCPT